MPIQLLTTNRIRHAINDVLLQQDIPSDFYNELKQWGRKDETTTRTEAEGIETVPSSTILYSVVKRAFDLLKKDGKPIYLNELLQGSDLYFEPIEEPKKSPELVSRLEKLQAKQNQLHYRSMVKNIDKELISKNHKEIAFEIRSTSRQLSSIVNFVLSVGGTFLFGFISSQYAFVNVGLRVIFGIILASIVALAELYFMARTEI